MFLLMLFRFVLVVLLHIFQILSLVFVFAGAPFCLVLDLVSFRFTGSPSKFFRSWIDFAQYIPNCIMCALDSLNR